jgi:hypothetical protein
VVRDPERLTIKGHAVTDTITADDMFILMELEERRGLTYRKMKELLGGSADRTIAVIDHLLQTNDIRRVRSVLGETHYRAAL